MVSKQEVPRTAASEVVALAEQQDALFQPIIVGLESRDPSVVASAAHELVWHRSTSLGIVEQVGAGSTDAQEALVTLLVANSLNTNYGKKVETARRLDYEFTAEQTCTVATLHEVLTSLSDASNEFDVSPEEVLIKMREWVVHTPIEDTVSKDQTTEYFKQQLALLDSLGQNEDLPEEIRAVLVARTQKGKEIHAQKLFESAQSYKANSVEFSYVSILYGSVQEDIQRLHLCGASEDQIETYAQAALQQLNAEDVRTAIRSTASLNKVRGLLLQLPWMLKNEALATELERLGITSDSFARIIALSLDNLVLSSALVSLAESVELLDQEMLQKILTAYFAHLGKQTNYEVSGTGLVGVAQKYPLREDDFGLLETMVQSAGMEWFSETVQSGLRRLQAR